LNYTRKKRTYLEYIIISNFVKKKHGEKIKVTKL